LKLINNGVSFVVPSQIQLR